MGLWGGGHVVVELLKKTLGGCDEHSADCKRTRKGFECDEIRCRHYTPSSNDPTDSVLKLLGSQHAFFYLAGDSLQLGLASLFLQLLVQ